MKAYIKKFLITYLLFTGLSIVWRGIFITFYHALFSGVAFTELFGAFSHGLPLDLSIAGYLSAIPGLLLVAAAFTGLGNKVIRTIGLCYFGLMSVLLTTIFIVDMALYEYWGFRLDATPIFYFTTSPKDALASVGFGYLAMGLVGIAMVSSATFLLFRHLLFKKERTTGNKWATAIAMLLMTGLLFIPIRGGFTVSTMNLSVAYFSQNQKLNHAAINPVFSLMYSATHQNNFDKQFRYMDAAKADSLITGMLDKKENPDSIAQLLTDRRPDIVMVILESFSSHLMKSTGGEDIAPNLDKIAGDGLLFTHFYANSFRTDRGLVSIISGYPAQPTTSIMKYAEKVENLPSIPRSLRNNGYDLAYYYGGDANFTNMYAYLVSCGFDKIISDKDFPLSERTGKWGANDEVVFNRFLKEYTTEETIKPRFRIIQTSSSHEPFDVPYHKLADKRTNAFAYTDSCVGKLIDRLKASPRWSNTLVVLVPDHYGVYPQLGDDAEAKHRIPLILAGGALKLKGRCDTYASQLDIAATLLYQLGIPHNEFTFSKNILNPESPHFGYFSEPSVWGIASKENTVVYSVDANKEVSDTGTRPGTNVEPGKAFLQKLYDDLSKR